MSNTELKTVTGIILDTFQDTMIKTSYIKVLTTDKIESIRLPSSLENYKYKYLLQPNYLLELELVKTRKNWILKDILSHESFYTPVTFEDYLSFGQLSKSIKENTRDQQQTDILGFVIEYFRVFPKLNIQHFELRLQQALGFR
jgi:hypothetical protein